MIDQEDLAARMRTLRLEICHFLAYCQQMKTGNQSRCGYDAALKEIDSKMVEFIKPAHAALGENGPGPKTEDAALMGPAFRFAADFCDDLVRS